MEGKADRHSRFDNHTNAMHNKNITKKGCSMSDNNKTTDEKKLKEDSRTKLEKLLDLKKRLEQALAREKAKQLGEGRKADAHIKAAIGGAVLGMTDLPKTIRYAILAKADAGIQKEGLAREKFEVLKAKVANEKAATVVAAQAAKQVEQK